MVLFASSAAFTGGCAYLNHNLRAVEPGVFYRSGQMPANALERTLHRHDIDTVVNLRGPSGERWYALEREVCTAAGAAHVDFDWSSQRLPEPESLAEYVALLEAQDGPMLVHCQGGTHRSGIAAAVYVLLHGGTVDDARKQLDIFFGNAPIGQLLDLYEGSERPFAEWISEDYPALYAACSTE